MAKKKMGGGDVKGRANKVKQGLMADNSKAEVVARAKKAGHGRGTTTEDAGIKSRGNSKLSGAGRLKKAM